jgi:hypothetical protein
MLTIAEAATVTFANIITVPTAAETIESARANRLPFDPREPGRGVLYQQAYDASFFSNLSPGGEYITEIRFRPSADRGFPAGPFSGTITDIEIRLATTAYDPESLNSIAALNPTGQSQVVWPRGSLTLSSGYLGPLRGPKEFDVVIKLALPFFYDPAQGNLLMEVRNYSGNVLDASFQNGVAFDAFDDSDGTSRDGTGRAFGDILFGNLPTFVNVQRLGLATQFATVVPEPQTLLLLLPATALMARRRRACGQ